MSYAKTLPNYEFLWVPGYTHRRLCIWWLAPCPFTAASAASASSRPRSWARVRRVRPLFGRSGCIHALLVSGIFAFLIEGLDQGVEVRGDHTPKKRMGGWPLINSKSWWCNPESHSSQEAWIIAFGTSIKNGLDLYWVHSRRTEHLEGNRLTLSTKGAMLAHSIRNSVFVSKIFSQIMRKTWAFSQSNIASGWRNITVVISCEFDHLTQFRDVFVFTLQRT